MSFWRFSLAGKMYLLLLIAPLCILPGCGGRGGSIPHASKVSSLLYLNGQPASSNSTGNLNEPAVITGKRKSVCYLSTPGALNGTFPPIWTCYFQLNDTLQFPDLVQTPGIAMPYCSATTWSIYNFGVGSSTMTLTFASPISAGNTSCQRVDYNSVTVTTGSLPWGGKAEALGHYYACNNINCAGPGDEALGIWLSADTMLPNPTPSPVPTPTGAPIGPPTPTPSPNIDIYDMNAKAIVSDGIIRDNIGGIQQTLLAQALPNGTALGTPQWSVNGEFVKDELFSNSSGTYDSFSSTDLQNPQLQFFWTQSAVFEASVTAQVSGQTQTATAFYNVKMPSVNISAAHGAVALDANNWAAANAPGDWALHFGTATLASPGISWNYQVSNVPVGGAGLIAVVQLVNSARSGTDVNKAAYTAGTGGQTCLDTNVPYANVTAGTSAGFTANDSPGKDLTSPIQFLSYSINDIFRDYFVYQPTEGGASRPGIWVSLANLAWSWSASAGTSNGSWSIMSGPLVSVPGGAQLQTQKVPVWNCNVQQ